MSRIITFFRESYEEMVHKVSWSKYSDLQNSAVLVLVASLIFALMIGAIDYAFENLMEFIYQEF